MLRDIDKEISNSREALSFKLQRNIVSPRGCDVTRRRRMSPNEFLNAPALPKAAILKGFAL